MRTKWSVHVPKRHLLCEFLKWQLKAETLFHTKSSLLCPVCWHVVSFLFALFFLTAWEPDVWPESASLVGHSNSNQWRASLCEWSVVFWGKMTVKILSKVPSWGFHLSWNHVPGTGGFRFNPQTKKTTDRNSIKAAQFCRKIMDLATLQGYYYLWFFMS